MFQTPKMFQGTILIWAYIWTECWTFTVDDQLILQLIALDPKDDRFVEKFLGIRAFETVPAVPHTEPPVTSEPKNKTRIKMPKHEPELIDILLRIRENQLQGKLPQPPFLAEHPRRGYHHPLALSPNGFPLEYFNFEGLPHYYPKDSDKGEIIREPFLPDVHQTKEYSEFTQPNQVNQTLEDFLEKLPLDSAEPVHNPRDVILKLEGKTIEELLTGDSATYTPLQDNSKIQVNDHPEEILQRESELKVHHLQPLRVQPPTKDPHLSYSLWESFLSPLADSSTQKAHRETVLRGQNKTN